MGSNGEGVVNTVENRKLDLKHVNLKLRRDWLSGTKKRNRLTTRNPNLKQIRLPLLSQKSLL